MRWNCKEKRTPKSEASHFPVKPWWEGMVLGNYIDQHFSGACDRRWKMVRIEVNRKKNGCFRLWGCSFKCGQAQKSSNKNEQFGPKICQIGHETVELKGAFSMRLFRVSIPKQRTITFIFGKTTILLIYVYAIYRLFSFSNLMRGWWKVGIFDIWWYKFENKHRTLIESKNWQLVFSLFKATERGTVYTRGNHSLSILNAGFS